jgi:hypothetical protein
VNNRDKQSAVGENQRAIHCMDSFECYEKLHITPNKGIDNVMIIRQWWHKSYVSITLLGKWHTHLSVSLCSLGSGGTFLGFLNWAEIGVHAGV